MKMRMLGALALGLAVAGCGVTEQERTTGGAAAGAATGAGIGALGGPPGALAGAAIGGGVGAVTGAVTEPNELNLGAPPWSNPQARVPGFETAQTGTSARSSARFDRRTLELQQALNDRGFNAGPEDGIYGPRTRQGVMAWQRANNMDVTGQPSRQMLSDLGIGSAGTGTGTAGTMNRGVGPATGAGVTQPGFAGGGPGPERPDPPTAANRRGVVPSPSNNPMNDPVGGNSGAIQPGFNVNQGSGGQGGSAGNSGTR